METKHHVLLKSKNIDYIAINESLINDYLIMVNDKEIQNKIYKEPRQYTYEDELSWVNQKLSEKAIIFSMLERTTGNFIGNIEFMNLVEKGAEIGIAITPTYQNKHYGTEALKTMIDYGFNNLGLEEITLIVFSNNSRAIHCYKKLGFIEYKVDKNITVMNNESIDNIHMKLKK